MNCKAFVCLMLCVLLLAGCANANAPEASGALKTQQALEKISTLSDSVPDDNYRTWYEVFVYSFCDSNGDGIGDLKGLQSKLPYLQELGITGLWLMPVHPSTTYHKYNVSDYYAIDPAYGTMADMEALLADCNSRNIRVILDLVVNHTGFDHPWFQAAADYLKALPAGQEPDSAQCKYLDYYHFSRDVGRELVGTDFHYEAMFSHDMPDLNLDNPEVRTEIEQIMKFWLDKGAAGFRLDAAKEFFSGRVSKNVEVLSWLQKAATDIKKDAYLVAEVWDTFANVTAYYESGISSIFNYPFGDSAGKIISVVRGADNPAMVTTYATALEKADKAYLGKHPGYIDAPFLSNHDVGRIAGFCGQDPDKTKLAGAMNLFMGGSCFVYYGEEIGMTGSGNDPSKRAPMYWNTARDSGTTNPPPECTVPEYPFPSLEQQRNTDGSIYNYYRQAIAIRNAIPAIARGRVTAETALNQGCVSAQRKTWNDQSCIILMNIASTAATVDLTDYAVWSLAVSLCTGETDVTLSEGTLQLPAYGIAILTPKQ